MRYERPLLQIMGLTRPFQMWQKMQCPFQKENHPSNMPIEAEDISQNTDSAKSQGWLSRIFCWCMRFRNDRKTVRVASVFRILHFPIIISPSSPQGIEALPTSTTNVIEKSQQSVSLRGPRVIFYYVQILDLVHLIYHFSSFNRFPPGNGLGKQRTTTGP